MYSSPTSTWPKPVLCNMLGFDPPLSGPAARLGAELKTHQYSARLCCQPQGCCCTGTATEGVGLKPTPGTGAGRGAERTLQSQADPIEWQAGARCLLGSSSSLSRSPGQSGWAGVRRAGVPNMGAGKSAGLECCPRHEARPGVVWAGKLSVITGFFMPTGCCLADITCGTLGT